VPKTLEALFSGKIRLKLLIKLFLNPDTQVYLRGLAKEFDVSTNTVRQDLNLFHDLSLIEERSHKDPEKTLANSSGKESRIDKSRKNFSVNTKHPLFTSLQTFIRQYVGLDQIVENVINIIGQPTEVYVTGDLANGIDSPIIDLLIVGDEIDETALSHYKAKTEKSINKKIRSAVFTNEEWQKRSADFQNMTLLKIF